MIINLSPQRRDDALEVIKNGDVLSINGEQFDFSDLPNGSTIPEGTVPCEWIVGPIDRDENGQLGITLILPHGPSPSQEVAFPEPIHVTVDGAIKIPQDVIPESESLDNVDA